MMPHHDDQVVDMLPLHFEVKTGVADTNHQVTAPPSTRQASNPPNSGLTIPNQMDVRVDEPG